MKGTRAHNSWSDMLKRCRNKKSFAFKDYGGRGITVCERWKKFENFLEDMGDPPTKMTLERINVNGNYEPKNCRWATRMEQGKNKRNNSFITFNGETKHLAEWAREKKMWHGTIRNRINKGWSIEKVFSKRNFHAGKKYLIYKGKEFSVKECAKINNLDSTTVHWRLNNGWTVEDIFETGNCNHRRTRYSKLKYLNSNH